MIHEDRFVLSRRPYAVKLDSLRSDEHHFARMDAVWFRRRNGVTYACAGTLWDLQRPVPRDAADFLARHDDGRYGGEAEARWDGKTLWAPEKSEDQRADYLAVLRPMLDNYPACPDGFDGWWRF